MTAAKEYRVADRGMQVVVDGVVYRPGDTFTADIAEAAKWARNGLVEPLDGSDPREGERIVVGNAARVVPSKKSARRGKS